MSTLSSTHKRQPSALRRQSVIVIAIICLAAIVGAIGYALATQPRVESHSPSGATNDASPTVQVRVANMDSATDVDVRATVDGRSVDDINVDRGTITADLPRLDDGTHEVRVRTEPVGLLRRTVDERWTIEVDTSVPPLRLDKRGLAEGAPRILADSTFQVRARTEPGAMIELVAGSERAEGAADGDGLVDVDIKLADGPHDVEITARDEAGNARSRTRAIFIDTTKPAATFTAPAKVTTATLDASLRVLDATKVRVRATIDGQSASATASEGSGSGSGFTIAGKERLSEGTHDVRLTITDEADNVAQVRKSLLVDSSETLGENTMKRGARGQDVRQLHMRLGELGLWKKDANPNSKREWRKMLFGASTAASVCEFQRDRGLSADCTVGEQTVAALTQRIVINRSTHTLTLYRNDTVVKVYDVAVGASKYPTPAGSFTIVDMQRNPTWNPPDSDWAKDAKPIPPGPKNPLGTRWMGLSVPAVGIHGTNNPASIGYSVSHGCIRMTIPQVEELFEIVELGTPVTIV